MKFNVHLTWIRNVTTAAVSAALLGGCLSDSKDEEIANAPPTTGVVVSGSVGDGPVVGANIDIRDAAGNLMAQMQSDANASYNISISAVSGDFPLALEASGGSDLVTNQAPDFMLKGAAFDSGAQTVANLSPFSTFAVMLTEYLAGGATANNLENAQEIVSSALNSGLDSLAATGPMTTPIDASNISEMVKASETLSEIVRRTRDLMQNAGFTANGDSIVAVLASDLTDGVIDGLGAIDTDSRTAAVSTIVAAQVLLESMANELHVNGNNATSAMAAAIDEVSPSTPTTTLDQLPVTADMIAKARIGLAAAFAVNEDPAISQLHAIVSDLQAGQSATSVRIVLPSDYRGILRDVLDAIAVADATTINLVNSIARTNGDLAPDNLAPSIQGTPATSVQVGNLYSFTPVASDADDDMLTFSVTNQPSWAIFDSLTGQLSGTPIAGDVGTYSNIVISVSDGEFSASLNAFAIEVTESNATPTISGTPAATVDAGADYSFTPTASDPDGDTLTFSITNQPSWASFNSSTGRLSGTPADVDAGTYGGIVISVSDGEFTVGLPAFSITVNSVVVNTPPEISGTPADNVNEGQSYSFVPDANDAEGDTLSFSISGEPSWADFDTSTGALTGTPSAGDVGVYTNIVISVSDGQESASLPAFSITVNAISLGSATLDWTAPTQNEDGTDLTDLAGFKLYWGTTPGNYTDSVTIDNPTVTTYLVENLAPGTYEFVATSFNEEGVESRYSGAATKVVQ